MELGLHKGHNLLYYECTEWKTPERTKCRDEKDFELLQALADSRNITKAADKLYITQSALSKRIRAIERELGVELLRSHQGIRFTPSGEAVLAHSRAAAREMDQMRRNLDALQGVICGTLNAGISIHYALYRLPWRTITEPTPMESSKSPPIRAVTCTARCWKAVWTLR